MTKKNQSSATTTAAKKPLTKTVPAAVVEPEAPALPKIQFFDYDSPAPRPALAQAALTWFHPDTDPRTDVGDARAVARASTGFWPTVLRLSPQVFDDLCNHPSVLSYLASAQLHRSYDCMRGPSARPFVANLFGVTKVEVEPDEPAASLQ